MHAWMGIMVETSDVQVNGQEPMLLNTVYAMKTDNVKGVKAWQKV